MFLFFLFSFFILFIYIFVGYPGYDRYHNEGRNHYDNGFKFDIPKAPNFGFTPKHENIEPRYNSYFPFGNYGSNNKFNEPEKKSASQFEAGNTHLDAKEKQEIEVHQDAYQQDLAHQGNQVYSDSFGKKKGFEKGEAFENGGYSGYDTASNYGGNTIAVDDTESQNAKVAYEVDHSMQYKNNFKDENHSGYYKGDEFDVGYKVKDVEGGYINDANSFKGKTEGYNGGKWDGNHYDKGIHAGTEYHDDGKYDYDGRQHVHGFSDGHNGPNYGDIPHDDHGDYYGGKGDSLYDRFKDDSFGPINRKKDNDYGKDWDVHGHSRDKLKYDDDKYTKKYGKEYANGDDYKKEFNDEAYAGVQEEVASKKQWDKGNYRDVAAKGHNKVANYEGDYNNNNKEHDVVYKVGHYEDLQTDFNTKQNSDIYKGDYDGKEFKGAFDADKKFGEYNDREYTQAFDGNEHAKKYQGNEHLNGIEYDTKADVYGKGNYEHDKFQGLSRYPAKQGYDYKQPPPQHPHGYAHQPQHGYGYSQQPQHNYGSPQPQHYNQNHYGY